jgi:hypothetical protein
VDYMDDMEEEIASPLEALWRKVEVKAMKWLPWSYNNRPGQKTLEEFLTKKETKDGEDKWHTNVLS